MAFIMVFNLLLPIATAVRVEAVTPPIGYMPGGLATGLTGSSPRNVPLAEATTAVGRDNQHVYMTFPLESFGNYVLTYPLSDGNHVRLYIEMINNVATITYIRPGAAANPDLRVWLAPMETRYIPIAEYVVRSDRPNNIDYQVVARHPLDPQLNVNNPTDPGEWPATVPWPPPPAWDWEPSVIVPPPGWPVATHAWPPPGWALFVVEGGDVVNPARPPGFPTYIPWPPGEAAWPEADRDALVPPPGWPVSPPWPPAGYNVFVGYPYIVNPNPPPGWIGSFPWPPNPADWDPMVDFATSPPGLIPSTVWPPLPPSGWELFTPGPPQTNVVRPAGFPLNLPWPPAEALWPLNVRETVPPPGWPQELPFPPTGWPIYVAGDRDPAQYTPLPLGTPPQFIISQDRGFSFIYRGEFIHIRLGSDNMLHFAADHFATGIIHEVVFTDLGTNISSGMYINTGLNNVNFIPFANAFPNGMNSNVNDRFPERYDYIHRRPGVPGHTFGTINNAPGGYERALGDGRWPAQPDEPLGFILEFDLPNFMPALDTDGVTLRPSVVPSPLTVLVDFHSAHSFELLVHDVLTNPHVTAVPSGIHVRNVGIVGNQLILEIVVLDPSAPGAELFLPSIMYSLSSNVTLVERLTPPGSGLFPLRTRVSTIGVPGPPGSNLLFGPFTLLNYEITVINGMYHVIIVTPYAQEGEYVIFEAPHPGTPGVGVPPGDITLSRTHFIAMGQPIPPIPLRVMDEDLTGERFIQVFFRPGNEFSEGELDSVREGSWPVRSQGIWWGGRPEDVTLRTPEYFDVTLIQHYPREGDLSRRTGIAELELTWDIGSPALLNHLFNTMAVNNRLDIYYEFQWSLNPYDVYPNRFMVVRASLESATPAGIYVTYTLLEVLDDGTMVEVNPLEGITLLTTERHRLINSPIFGFMGQLRIEVNTYHLMRYPHPDTDTLGAVPPRGLNFPSIYFMNVRPIQVMNNTNFQTPSSQYSSFTLSEFEDPEVPPPQNLRVVPGSERPHLPDFIPNAVTSASFDITWDVPLSRMQDYLMRSYGFLRRGAQQLINFADFDLEMTIYISQDEQLMVNSLGIGTGFPEDPELHDTSERHDARMSASVLHMDANGQMDGTIDLSGAERDRLRDGGIVAIHNLAIPDAIWESVVRGDNITTPDAFDLMHGVEFTLDGLDKNQHYYVYVDFVVTQRPHGRVLFSRGRGDSIVVWNHIIKEASLISNLVGVTIPTDPDPPDGIDVDPPAPNLRVDEESIGLNTATIYWDRVEPIAVPPGYTESLEYQVIRIRDNQMLDDAAARTQLLNSRIPFAQVWAALTHHEHIVGFETLPGTAGDEPRSAMSLRALQGRPNAPNMELISIEHSDPPGMDPLRVRDDSLASNNLYFYYARTVRVVRDAAGVEVARRYSVWSNVSVTTTIAGAPRNLRIEHGPDREFDRRHQIMFSFEAPIGAHPNSLAFLGTEFIFEYSIRLDQEDWQEPVVMGNTYLRTHARAVPPDPDDDVEWTWFLYFITEGLESGSYYSIRVRLVELCTTTGVPLSYSIWSNIATWMTEICCCDEDEIIRDDWIDYLRRRLEELKRRPYWTIRQDAGGHQVIYRPGMFNNLLQTSVGGQIQLPFETSRQSTYYIPMESFQQAWYAQQGFLLVNDDGNMQISLPARAIDTRENDVIIDVAAYIRRSRGDFVDSMVRLNIDWSHPLLIQNEEPITPVADVRIDIITTRHEIARWCNDLYRQVEELIEEILADERILDDVLEAIQENIPSEDISRYMVRVVQDAERQVYRLVQQNMTTLTRNSRAANMPSLDRGMSVSTRFDADSGALEGYQSLAGNLWTNMPTMQVGDGQGFFTNQLASFVFTGRIINIPGLETIEGGPQARGVIGRHGLDDFFGRGSINIYQSATRSMLVDSLARMIGAPRGSNSVQWLRAEGIDVSAAGMNNPITNQAALHLLMLVYENRTGTRLDSLQIRNFNVVNNLQGLDSNYRTAVAAAIELNLVDGSTFQPNGILTIGELLEMLAVMDSLLGL